ncbi:MAG: AsmA-like C-terminal region-containing protein [Bacteroidota bacterium]
MKKKILRIFGALVLVLVGMLVALPFFLESKIADIIKNKVNQNSNATLDFEEANLSLIKSFPAAYVDLKAVSLVNKAPFEGDTLFSAEDIELEMSIKELFKSADEPIGIKKLHLDKAKLHIKVDTLGNANYDIALEVEAAEQEPIGNEGSSFTLDFQEYAITHAQMIYDDFSSDLHLIISEMNHSGSGNLSLEDSKLQTDTDALVSFEMGGTQYLNKHKIALDALIGIDLNENNYSFLENSALVNQLPLVFDGFVQVNEENQEVDISFKTPSSDFKNFLAVIPEAYASNLDGVTTTGNFEVTGKFKGIVDDDHIPTFNITINSQNASFKYPDLPKTVRSVFIDTEINNETGITEDTYININQLSFQIDEDTFNLNAKIRELLGNTKVNLHGDGKINLANISKAYPMPTDYALTGILNADVTTTFDMASLEKQQYQNTKTSGKASLKDFHYESGELKNPVDIQEAALTFNPNKVSLDAFSGKTGQTDFNAKGTLSNLLGYMFNDEDLKGRFNLQSNTLAVNDFTVEETGNQEIDEEDGTTPTAERIKIPSFLDATIDASANSVLYDNLDLKNLKGRLIIKDETATLENLSSEIFDGKLALNGTVSTKGEITTFDMGLGIDGFKISESFQALKLFKTLAPIAQAFQGRLNSSIELSGNLKDDMTLNLGTLSGDLLGQLLAAKVDTQSAPTLAALNNQFDFIDLNALNFNDLKTALSFSDGNVATKPITLNYKDIAIKLSGSHTFDAQLQYQATLDVPAKYLGSEVNNLITQIDDDSLKNLTIPVIANISGGYTSPDVSTDLTSGVTKLTQQLIEIQKQKLLDQGKDKAKDLLGGLLNQDNDSMAKDSTKSSGVSQVLDGLLRGKKTDTTQRDSTQQNDGVKDAAKSILGGLLGKKNKDTTKQKQ